jgi:hypothetical protein
MGSMKKLLLVGTASILASLLGGCVVAPIPEPVAYGPPPPRVVVAPPPAVVVRPAPVYRYYPAPYWRRWH